MPPAILFDPAPRRIHRRALFGPDPKGRQTTGKAALILSTRFAFFHFPPK